MPDPTPPNIPYWFLYLSFGGGIFLLGLFLKGLFDNLFKHGWGGEDRRKTVTFTIDEESVRRFIDAIESHSKATQAAADKLSDNNALIRDLITTVSDKIVHGEYRKHV